MWVSYIFIRIILILVSTVLWDVQNTFTFATSLTDLKKYIDCSVRSSDNRIPIMIWPHASHLGWITLNAQYRHFEETWFKVIYDQEALKCQVTMRETIKEKSRKLLKIASSEGSLAVFLTPCDAFIFRKSLYIFSNCIVSLKKSIWGYFYKENLKYCALPSKPCEKPVWMRSLLGGVVNITFLNMKDNRWNWRVWKMKVCRSVRTLFIDLNSDPFCKDGAVSSARTVRLWPFPSGLGFPVYPV